MAVNTAPAPRMKVPLKYSALLQHELVAQRDLTAKGGETGWLHAMWNLISIPLGAGMALDALKLRCQSSG